MTTEKHCRLPPPPFLLFLAVKDLKPPDFARPHPGYNYSRCSPEMTLLRQAQDERPVLIPSPQPSPGGRGRIKKDLSAP